MPDNASDRTALTRARQEALRAESYAARLQSIPPDIQQAGSVEAIRAVEDANLMRFSALGELARDALRGSENRSQAFPKPVMDILNKDGALKTLADFRNNVLHPTDGTFIGVSPDNVGIEKLLGQLRDNLEALKKNPELLRQLSPAQIETLSDLSNYAKTIELHTIEDLKDPDKAKAILNDAASFHEARAACFVEEAAVAKGYGKAASKAGIDTNEYANMRHNYHDAKQRLDHSEPRAPKLSEIIDANADKLGGFDPSLRDYSQDSKITDGSIAFGSDVKMDLRHASQAALIQKIENIAKGHGVAVVAENVRAAMEGLSGDELKSLNDGISALNGNKDKAFKEFLSNLPEGQKDKVLIALTDIATGFGSGKWAEKLADKIVKATSELSASGISVQLRERLETLADKIADTATVTGNEGLMQKAVNLLESLEGLVPEKLVKLGAKVGANIAFIGGTVAAAEMAFKTKEAMAAYQSGELNDKQLAACLSGYSAYIGQAVLDPTVIGGEEAIEASLAAAGVPEKFRTGTLRQAVASLVDTSMNVHIHKSDGSFITNAEMAKETQLLLESIDKPEKSMDPDKFKYAKLLYDEALSRTGDPEKAKIYIESMRLQARTGLEPSFAFDFPTDFKEPQQEQHQAQQASMKQPAAELTSMQKALASAKEAGVAGMAHYNPDGKREGDMVTAQYAAAQIVKTAPSVII